MNPDAAVGLNMERSRPGRNRRVLALGIDAASPALIGRWIADGSLPRLAELARRGGRGTTHGVDGFFVGSTWPSLITGSNPATHGIHYQVQIRPGTYEFFEPLRDDEATVAPFWEALTRAGRRALVLDVPLSRISPGLLGAQIVEWGCHDAFVGFGVHPPDLGSWIATAIGPHPVGSRCDQDGRTAAHYATLIDALERGAALRTRLTLELLARENWDVAIQVFSEAHCAGHQCWHLHDPTHPGHDPALRASLGDPLLRVYRAIDEAVGEIVAAVSDADILIFSAHGMGPWYGAHFLLQPILEALGVTAPVSRPSEEERWPAARRVWRRLPSPLRDAVRRVIPGPADRGSPPRPRLASDPARSDCFAVPNGLAVSGIRLNLRGREPLGRLDPAGRDRFVDRLRRDLLEVIDERTGRPLIRRVVAASDYGDGPAAARLPDLLVEWDEHPTGSAQIAGGAGSLVRARSPKIGIIEGANSYGRTGEHRRDGFIIAVGPEAVAGDLGQISTLEIAPTILALQGVPGDDRTDSRLLDSLRGRPGPGVA